MRELRYGRHMLDYNFGNRDIIKWIFPENIHINTYTLYEVEYQVIEDEQNCIYKVTYIKPVSKLIEHLHYILLTYKEMKQINSFEKWFREHYKLQAIK